MVQALVESYLFLLLLTLILDAIRRRLWIHNSVVLHLVRLVAINTTRVGAINASYLLVKNLPANKIWHLCGKGNVEIYLLFGLLTPISLLPFFECCQDDSANCSCFRKDKMKLKACSIHVRCAHTEVRLCIVQLGEICLKKNKHGRNDVSVQCLCNVHSVTC